MPISVLIVDDTSHVRELLASMLELDGFNVIGQASDGPSGVRASADLQPDVVIMDYSMPGMDGVETTRVIRAENPAQSVILYTAFMDDAVRKAAIDAGAALVVGKVDGLETLERSISELCLQLGKA
jgi:DNA-binding NarL/FixJ family response regulator